MIELYVNGKPRSSGSKSGFIIDGKVIMTPAGKYQKSWMEAVKWAAIEAGHNGKMLIEGPVLLNLVFSFLRPKSHFKKNGELTKSARPQPTCKPDLDKLNRAISDALTGLIWRDDSQVIELTASKVYAQPEGCKIIIHEYKGEKCQS